MQFITIMFVANIGKSFAGTKRIPNGLTLLELLQQEMPGQNPENYLVTVNRDKVTDLSGHVLKEGERVTVSPTKVAAGILHELELELVN